MKKSFLLICSVLVAVMMCATTVDASAATPKKRTGTTKTAVKPVNLEGETYVGEGNGGGMAIWTSIDFMSNGKCVCTSNFHDGTDVQPYKVDCTYKVSGRTVTVTIPREGEDEPLVWKFKLSANGEEMSYNNSDYNMGSMGLDYQTLGLEH